MLYSLDGDKIKDIPKKRKADFNQWRKNLSCEDYEKVRIAINAYIDNKVHKNEPFVSSHIPGPDWRGTPYQSLYLACGQSMEQSGWFFGLIVWQVVIDRPEDWVFKLGDKDEDDVQGTTYWLMNNRVE
jgi:hypothetical protein